MLDSLLSPPAQGRRVHHSSLQLHQAGLCEEAGRLALTSDLLLQAEDDSHGLMEDQELGLGLVTLEVELHHAAELLESLVDVADPQALASVVGHPPLLLPLGLLLRCQVLVIIIAAGQKGCDIF